MGREGFPGGIDGKESACDAGDLCSIPGSGRCPREGNGNPLQYSCLENPMDRGAWWPIGHGVARVGHDFMTKPWVERCVNTHLYIHVYRFVCIFIHTHTCTWVCTYVHVCMHIPPTRGSQITPKAERELEHKISPFCFPCPEVYNLLKTLPEAAISRTEEQKYLFYKNYPENVFTKVLSHNEDTRNMLSR